MEVHHGGNLDGVQLGGPVNTGFLFAQLFTAGGCFTFLALTNGVILEHHPGEGYQKDHVQPAHNLVNVAKAFQLHDYLGTNFHTDNRADQHGQAQLVVNVAKAAVTHGRNQRFACHVGNVCADSKGHREAKNVQAGGHHPGAAHAKESADNTHTEAENDKAGPEYGAAGNGHENI